jgi:hypothetical protein
MRKKRVAIRKKNIKKLIINLVKLLKISKGIVPRILTKLIKKINIEVQNYNI